MTRKERRLKLIRERYRYLRHAGYSADRKVSKIGLARLRAEARKEQARLCRRQSEQATMSKALRPVAPSYCYPAGPMLATDRGWKRWVAIPDVMERRKILRVRPNWNEDEEFMLSRMAKKWLKRHQEA